MQGGDSSNKDGHQELRQLGRSPSNDSPFALELHPNDVACGRGTGISQYSGNIRFRELIKDREKQYNSTSRHKTKSRIAIEIYQTIQRRSGRFLRTVETHEEIQGINVPFGAQAWVIVDKPDALTKIKQALRDASTTKRAALVHQEMDAAEDSTQFVAQGESSPEPESAHAPTPGLPTIPASPLRRATETFYCPTKSEPMLLQGHCDDHVASRCCDESTQREESLQLSNDLPGSDLALGQCQSRRPESTRAFDPATDSRTPNQADTCRDDDAYFDRSNAFDNLRTIDDIVSSARVPLDAALATFLLQMDTNTSSSPIAADPSDADGKNDAHCPESIRETIGRSQTCGQPTRTCSTKSLMESLCLYQARRDRDGNDADGSAKSPIDWSKSADVQKSKLTPSEPMSSVETDGISNTRRNVRVTCGKARIRDKNRHADMHFSAIADLLHSDVGNYTVESIEKPKFDCPYQFDVSQIQCGTPASSSLFATTTGSSLVDNDVDEKSSPRTKRLLSEGEAEADSRCSFKIPKSQK